MLYALRHPLAFVALAGGFVLAVALRGFVQAWVATWLGAREHDLRRRRRIDIRLFVDPFGSVVAALAGTGWGRAADVGSLLGRFAYGRARGSAAVRAAAVLLAGPAVCIGASLLFFGAYRAGAANPTLRGLAPSDALHGDGVSVLNAGPLMLACMGFSCLAVGIVALFPIPPLDGGRLLLAMAPTTPGWQRLRSYADQNWGVAVLLVLLLIPLARGVPLLLALVDAIGQPIINAVSP